MIEQIDDTVFEPVVLVVTFSDRVERWGPVPRGFTDEVISGMATNPPDGFVSALVEAPEARSERYSPDQPRVPDGPDGGQWTDAYGETHDSKDPDPYGERMELEAARRIEARTPDDQEAVEMYQSSRWLEINDRLRAGEELPTDSYEGGLGRNSGHNPASDAARVDEMMDREGGLPFATDLWRGVSSQRVFPSGDLTGTTFSDLGYISTTANKDTAEGFSFPGGGARGNIMVLIKAPKGSRVVLAEGEVILARGTRFRILSDKATGGNVGRLITAEILQ